ncbi:MAG: succinate dehydrogenase, cytochrome b556 subunit [Sphingomonas sp.]|jgi:succinate dehydrogenase / fumarate reductase cytochrome b subunit|nr:succinate dehydrogenase, cytochrome b556 subunit [Sphingomonas sp.]
MAAANDRPLSPHLTIWKWGPHMLVSILHRITGAGLTLIGLPVLVWWLMSAADGAKAYTAFADAASHWAGLVVLIGLTWAFFQKSFAGIRHLVMDTGMGFELDANKKGAILTIAASLVCTAAIWAYVLGARQ